MLNTAMIEQNKGELSNRDYEKEVLGFLRRMILEKNNVSEEDNKYHLETMNDIYKETLEFTAEKVGRVPTVEELMSALFHYNYGVIWQLSRHDYMNGLGPHGIRDHLDFSDATKTDGEYIEEIYEHWADYLAFDLGMNTVSYMIKLLCLSNFCYIDDFNFHYKRTETLELAIYVNDSQNLLFPDWHYESITKHYPSESKDYIVKMQFVDEKVYYINLGEDDGS